MTPLPITLFTAGILGIIYVVLSLNVAMVRARSKVMLGTGGADATGTPLFLAVRAHGNFGEYVPLALILLGGVEVSGASRLTCEIYAGMLIIGRLVHPLGIYRPAPNAFRGIGAVLTWLTVLGLSVEALRLL
jgi:uncharacterized membrane protein YecN with MAPEG domain